MVWSWAVTSLRFFGRLDREDVSATTSMTIPISKSTYYFSTQGCALGVSWPFFSCLLEPLAAAAFLALMSKKLAMATIEEKAPVQKRREDDDGGDGDHTRVCEKKWSVLTIDVLGNCWRARSIYASLTARTTRRSRPSNGRQKRRPVHGWMQGGPPPPPLSPPLPKTSPQP